MRVRWGKPRLHYLLVAALLLSLGAPPALLAAGPARQDSSLLCGELITDYRDSGMTAYMYTVLVTCSGERILWQPTAPGSGSCSGLCRIEGAVLVPKIFELRGGTVTQKLIGFSRVETIAGCQACVPPPPSAAPPPPPTDTPPPPPTNTPLPPTHTPPPPSPTVPPPPVPTNTLPPPLPTATRAPAATDTPPPPAASTAPLPAPTDTAAAATLPANVVLDDLSVKVRSGARLGADADLSQILEYEDHLSVVALRSNTLWFKVSNRGQAAFEPPGGEGHYVLQVNLTSQQGTTTLATFSSREDNLIPLYALNPGRSTLIGPITLRISNTPLSEGTLSVSLVPDPGLGLDGSRVDKAITVADFSEYDPADCLVVTLAAVLKPVAGDLSESVAGELLDGAVDVTVLCRPDDWLCTLRELAEWAVTLVIKTALEDVSAGRMPDIGKAFSVIIEMYELVADQNQMYETMGEKGCWEAAAWFNALTGELNDQGRPAHGILTQSPVYPLAVDRAGRRAGFEAGGRPVAEIPGSRAAEIGEERIVLLPGAEPVELQVIGYGAGTMDLHTVFARDGGASIVTYDNVATTQSMRASVSSEDGQHLLHVDADGDGQAEQSRPPDTIEEVEAEGQAAGRRGLLLGLFIGLLGLVAVLALVLILILLRPRGAPRMAPGGRGVPSPGRAPGSAPRPGRAPAGAPRSTPPRGQVLYTLVDRARPEIQYHLHATVTIGRSRDSGLVLEHATVSRRHAWITVGGGEVWLSDAGSTNGTWLNGRPVREPARLAHGDVVCFGAVELIFTRNKPA